MNVFGRGIVCLARVHAGRAVDYIRVAAPGPYDVVNCLVVELASDVKVEVSLVSSESRFEGVIEFVGEIGEGVGDVTEVLKVAFELCQALVFFTSVAAG